MGDRRRSFSREFKLEAARLVTEGGLRLSQAARDLGVRESVLGRRKKQLSEDPEEAFPCKGHMKPQGEESRRLIRENKMLRQSRDILKSWRHLRAVAPVNYQFVRDNSGQFPGQRMCRMLGVSTNTYA